MHGYYFLFLLLAPTLIIPAYATHYTDYGLSDELEWREFDNDAINNVFCAFRGVLDLPNDNDMVSFECKHGVYDGSTRSGALLLMKVLPKAAIYNNTSGNVFTWYFNNTCLQASCNAIGMAVMDGAYDYSSLTEPGGFPNNADYQYSTTVEACNASLADWELGGAAYLCLGNTGSDVNNIIGAGSLNVIGATTPSFVYGGTNGKGYSSLSITITNTKWLESTQNYITVFLVLNAGISATTTDHYLQPRAFTVTNTDHGTLTWNFPETITEAEQWESHGGAGEYQVNGTSADYGYIWSYDPDVPDAPTLLYAVESPSTTSLYWTAPVFDGYSDIIGYKIERECPSGAGFTTYVANTGSTTTGYTDPSPGTDCNYRVRALNTFGESSPSNESTDYTGPTGSDPIDLHPDDISCDQPIDELHLTIYAVSTTTATLCWNNNFSIGSGNFTWTQINYTTPFGDPQTEYVNSTEVNYTTWVLTGLTPNTQYSTQVTLANDNPYTNSSNIANFTTLPTNFVIGQIFDNATNPNTLRIPFDFDRTDLNGTSVQVDVSYPDTYNTTCIIEYEFARTNSTYSNLSTTALANNRVQASFVFLNPTNDLIQMYCYDENDTTENARYVLTWGTFPLKEMFDNFRNGTYGTVGGFGTLDLATMLILTVAMIGFNRTNQIVGVIVAIGVVGITWVLGIITLPALIVIPPLALIGVLAFASYSRSDG